MGMAASQARYLALVARKSNCEYEGQQINQARTALSNQSANLFNQMLGLSVPVPPSTQDYTTTQYSYTDGLNGSTITEWKQLATPEEDYNYIVTHHYNTDVYTGAQKKLSDPQVQYSKGVAGSSVEITAALKTLTSTRAEYDKIQADYDTLIANFDAAKKSQEDAQATYDAALLARQKAEAVRDESLTAYEAAKTASEDFIATGSNYDNLKIAKETAQTNLNNAITAAKDIANYQVTGSTWTYGTGDTKTRNADGTYTMGSDTFVPLTSLNESSSLGSITYEDITKSIDALIDIGALPANFDKSSIYITANDSTPALAFKSDLDNALVSATNYTVPRYEIDTTNSNSILKKVEANQANIDTLTATYDTEAYRFSIVDAEYQNLLLAELQAKNNYDVNEAVFKETDNAFNAADVSKQLADNALLVATEAKDTAMVEYEPIVTNYTNAQTVFNSYQTPEFLGNCELTLLESLTKDQAAELKQIVADMSKMDIIPAINDCFDATTGEYTGGIYQFKMNGVTYYTSFAELNESFQSGTGINHIDGQSKLNYYNASYVETKIEKTEKALIETDGYGRFTSIRFEDNSVTYALNMETVTDDAAYQDAMNQYYYENAKYDKMIQDINAKTSIIQQEDQQLELRLKQLDTEQKALTTEMEAVKKVVNDNIESSFKTFGG